MTDVAESLVGDQPIIDRVEATATVGKVTVVNLSFTSLTSVVESIDEHQTIINCNETITTVGRVIVLVEINL